ncbi:MAG: ABC transporter ATP-binding protein [Clostridiales bacterium]|nr:ABC transporter ATP-binding protein [Clostridiales bacterium]
MNCVARAKGRWYNGGSDLLEVSALSSSTTAATRARNLTLTRRFLPYFRPYRGVMALDLFCASLTTVCELVLPLIVRYITDLGMNDLGALTVRAVLLMGGAYALLRVIDTVANYYMSSVGHIMGSHIETDMRRDLFAHLHKLSSAYYDNAKIGQLMARITTDLNEVTEFAHHCPEEFFIAGIKIVVTFAILCTMNVWLALMIFAMLPLMALSARLLSKKMRQAFVDMRYLLGELNSQVEDSLLGVRVVKSFANEGVEERKFGVGNQRFLDVKKRAYYAMAGFHSATRLFDGLMYITVVVVGALFMIGRQITAADLVACLLYVTMLLNSVRRIVEFTEQFQRGMTGIERFAEVMDEPITVHDKPGARVLSNASGEVQFDHVYFRYGENLENVLSDINLVIAPGSSVALVGPSGGGKTTMCSLIPRFYDVSSGAIRIDGHDVRDLTLSSLRSQIGVVQQDVYLFSGTVRENIEYGRPGAPIEDIVEAAKLAGAHEFIQSLPEGYDTFVGERGVKLSGGQKQRVSIARVFLKNPPILILDEATSALDNESEQLVQASLEQLARGRTTFTIAHRLTTIRNAGLILVLTDEGIVERGNHRELMTRRGIYYNMYHMYTQESA